MMAKNEMLKAIHQGEIELNGFSISCAVLEDGTRVLVNRSLANAFGIKGGGAYWQKKKSDEKGALLPEYLSAKYLQKYIPDELYLKLSESIPYKNKAGVETDGIKADLLPDICDIYVKAGEKGAFKNAPEIADNAYKIILGFSKVGIIALVDEATGYQYEREKDELQKILKAYITPELLPWQKTFPDIFYKEIYRLNGWDFTVESIRKRPGVVGKWTNKIVYDQLPKGVLSELKKNTPKSKAGNYTARFFQSLTEDIGNPHLQNQLSSVIAVMQISDNWKHFIQNFNKLVDRRKGQLELNFEEFEPSKQIEEPMPRFDLLLSGLLNTPTPSKDD